MIDGPHRPTTGHHRALLPLGVSTRVLAIAASVGILAVAHETVARQDAGAPTGTPPAEELETGVEAAQTDPRLEDAPPVDENWFLFGRWGDRRSELAGNGITFDINWTQTFQSVVDGGADTGFSLSLPKTPSARISARREAAGTPTGLVRGRRIEVCEHRWALRSTHLEHEARRSPGSA